MFDCPARRPELRERGRAPGQARRPSPPSIIASSISIIAMLKQPCRLAGRRSGLRSHHVDRVAVHRPAFGEPVRSGEAVRQRLVPCARRRVAPSTASILSFHVRPEAKVRARGRCSPAWFRRSRSHGSCVGDRDGNHAPDERIVRELRRSLERDVAGRNGEVEDPVEHRLDPTAFGADNEVDTQLHAGCSQIDE
jgi:hypothetical protein